MKSIQEILNVTDMQISESSMYDDMIAKLTEAKENGTPIDEGLFGAIFGGSTKPLSSLCTIIKAPIIRVVLPQDV